jgi:hypothetical protein
MKVNIPTPVFVAVAVLLLAGAVFFVWSRSGADGGTAQTEVESIASQMEKNVKEPEVPPEQATEGAQMMGGGGKSGGN